MYRCDGADAWVAVTVPDDDAWAALLQLLHDPALADLAGADLAARTAAHDRIDEALGRWTATRTPIVAAKELQAHGIAAAPAFTNRDLVLDEHLAARGFIVSWDHPDVGVQRYPGWPVHFAQDAGADPPDAGARCRQPRHPRASSAAATSRSTPSRRRA